MSKITPGKWTAEYDAPNDVWAIVMRHEYSDGSAYVKCIAQHVDDSNARAIAAVPEMMAALIADERLFSSMVIILDDDALLPHVSMQVIKGRLAAVRAALAKAKGETP